MSRKRRSDALRNRQAILRAAGDIIRVDPQSLTIQAVAERAGVSATTVYRHYASAEAILGTYMIEVDAQIRDFSHDCTTAGPELFDDVLKEWGSIIEVYGPGLVQLRSRRGFLDRLTTGDTAMQMVRDAWERPIRRLLRTEEIDDSYFDGALFLFNMMFDPRELLDLRARDMPMETVLAVLKDAYLGALHGWQEAGTRRI